MKILILIFLFGAATGFIISCILDKDTVIGYKLLVAITLILAGICGLIGIIKGIPFYEFMQYIGVGGLIGVGIMLICFLILMIFL